MRDAWRHLRASLGEYYYELPRMVAVSLVWFILCVPAIWVGFRAWVFLGPDEGLEVGIDSVPAVAFAVQATVFGLLSLVIAGPATAGLHAAVAPLAHGELFEIGRFVRGARHHFRRAWLLLTLDVLVGTVLALNVWFYWHTEVPGAWLLSILFGYALLAWAALQPYLADAELREAAGRASAAQAAGHTATAWAAAVTALASTLVSPDEASKSHS